MIFAEQLDSLLRYIDIIFNPETYSTGFHTPSYGPLESSAKAMYWTIGRRRNAETYSGTT